MFISIIDAQYGLPGRNNNLSGTENMSRGKFGKQGHPKPLQKLKAIFNNTKRTIFVYITY